MGSDFMSSSRWILLIVVLLILAVVFACAMGYGFGRVMGERYATSAKAMVPTPAFVTATPTVSPTPKSSPTALPATNVPTSTPIPLDKAAMALEGRLTTIYQDESPAVVNITTQILRRDFFWGVIPESGAGSGFLWDADGHIVTNYHVIEDAHTIDVSFGPGMVFTAQVIGVDPPNDLAVIKVDEVPEGVHPLALGDSDALRVGQIAIAIGNPFGRFQRTMTMGIVSALDRTIRIKEGRILRRVIQTDADINRGNSGGPLLDSSGRVIGVISAIYSPTGANAGVGLAIPINKAKRVVPVLIEKGRFAHPWLGIEHLGYEITPYLARALGLPVTRGLLIAQIYDNSPAMRAGIRPADKEIILGNTRYLIGGDILIAIDGVPLKTWEDLDAYLQENTEVGQIVTLDILRNGKQLQIQAPLGEEP